MICTYYTAHAAREYIWLIIAHLKSHDNIAFHRTMDGTSDRMEFFVPKEQEPVFKKFLEEYQQAGFLFSYQQEENRLTL